MPYTYSYTVEHYGRTEHRLDARRFAEDLARAFGGTMIPESEEYEKQSSGDFTMPADGVKIRVYRSYIHKAEQVGLYISATDVPRDVESSLYGDKYKLPSITVSTARPLASLVKDIQRRLIDAAAPALAARRDMARQHAEAKTSMASAVAAMRRKFPDLRIEVNSKGTESTFYSSAPYLAGRIYNDGSVTIDRMGSMPANQFAAVLRVLRESK